MDPDVRVSIFPFISGLPISRYKESFSAYLFKGVFESLSGDPLLKGERFELDNGDPELFLIGLLNNGELTFLRK